MSNFFARSKCFKFSIYLESWFKWKVLWKYINLAQNIQWVSKLKASHAWGRNHLKNALGISTAKYWSWNGHEIETAILGLPQVPLENVGKVTRRFLNRKHSLRESN